MTDVFKFTDDQRPGEPANAGWERGVQNVVKARKVESKKSFEDIMFNVTPKYRS